MFYDYDAVMSSSADRFARKKVAVIGSGSAGIAALWALNRTYHDVYLYEGSSRLGGHTHTVQWKSGKFTTSVDTGFTVFNEATSRKTHPIACAQAMAADTPPANFLSFLNKLNVKTEPTDLTLSLSRDDGRFEWANTSLRSIFTRRRTFFSPKTWRTLFDVLRFNEFALDVLVHDGTGKSRGEETMGEYLYREGYSDGFKDDYLIPLAAMLWSTSPDTCSLAFPIAVLVRFM